LAALLALGLAVVVSDLWGSVAGGERAFAEDTTAAGRIPKPLPNRTSCADIDRSDLRSPEEGLWFEANCGTARNADAPPAACNRTALDAREFVEAAPGFFVYRHPGSSSGYLWYAAGENCYELVSSRVVTAVCADRVVTFKWSQDACASHGGTLVRVNGR
jgi:hypothetical protein